MLMACQETGKGKRMAKTVETRGGNQARGLFWAMGSIQIPVESPGKLVEI